MYSLALTLAQRRVQLASSEQTVTPTEINTSRLCTLTGYTAKIKTASASADANTHCSHPALDATLNGKVLVSDPAQHGCIILRTSAGASMLRAMTAQPLSFNALESQSLSLPRELCLTIPAPKVCMLPT